MKEKYGIISVNSDKSIIKNSKKKDLNNKNQISIGESLINIICKSSIIAKEKLSKILVIGFNLNQIYNRLNKEFFNAQFLITNTSMSVLNSFRDEHRSEENYTIYILDVFDGRSLFDFVMKFNKFDLIIISDLYNYSENKEKVRNSTRFIYKHLLKKNGLLCLITLIRELEFNRFAFLKDLDPNLIKKFEYDTKKNPIDFITYIKK